MTIQIDGIMLSSRIHMYIRISEMRYFFCVNNILKDINGCTVEIFCSLKSPLQDIFDIFHYPKCGLRESLSRKSHELGLGGSLGVTRAPFLALPPALAYNLDFLHAPPRRRGGLKRAAKGVKYTLSSLQSGERWCAVV